MTILLLGDGPVRVLTACVATLLAANAAIVTARLADAASADADPKVVIVEEAPDDTVRIARDEGSRRSVDPSTPEGTDAVVDAEEPGDTVDAAPTPGAPSGSAPAAQSAGDGDAAGDVLRLPSVPGAPGAPGGDGPSDDDSSPVPTTLPRVTVTTPPVTVTTPPVTVTTPGVSVTTPPVTIITPVTTVTVPTTTVTVPATTVTVPPITVTVPPVTVTTPDLDLDVDLGLGS